MDCRMDKELGNPEVLVFEDDMLEKGIQEKRIEKDDSEINLCDIWNE